MEAANIPLSICIVQPSISNRAQASLTADQWRLVSRHCGAAAPPIDFLDKDNYA